MPRSKSKTIPKPLSGGARMKLAGRHPVQLGLTASELEVIRQAADLDSRPVTQFVTLAALAAAREKISEKSAG